jgi:bla regulator protein BlaR1
MSWCFEIVATNALGALLLALVARLAERPLRRWPGLVRGLWLLVLLRLLMPPIVEVELPPLPVLSSRVALPLALAGTLQTPVPELDAQPRFSSSELVVLIWLLGSLLILIFAAVRTVDFYRGLGDAEPASEGLRAEVARLSARMGIGRPPAVFVVPGPLSPLVWGLPPRVRLVIPRSLIGRLSPEELRALLAHELAHVAHGDPWVRYVELGVRTLFWWQPVVWWAGSRLRRAEEHRCDARVVSTLPQLRRAYAGCLVKTLRFLSEDRVAALLPACGLMKNTDLEGRLTMIITRAWAEDAPQTIRLGAVALGLAVLTAFPSFASGGATPAESSVDAAFFGQQMSWLFPQDWSDQQGGSEPFQTPSAIRRFKGKPIDIFIRGAELREVMDMFSQFAELRLALDPAIKGTVTLELRGVSWDQALEQVLRLNRLKMTKEGRVWYVHPIEAEGRRDSDQN